MSRWFRVYDDLVDDPKVQRLSTDLFRLLVNLWCLASKNGGKLPSVGDMEFTLRIRPDRLERMIDELRACGLIDGDEPHNWGKRQYKSDVTDPTAADRQQRYRNKRRNADRNGTVTDGVTGKRPEAETEQKQKKDIRTVAKATRPTNEDFEKFWRAYPKRKGANPKAPAEKLFTAATKAGIDPAAIVAALMAGAGYDPDKMGTEYIPQAVKWLRDRRWEEHTPASPEIAEERARFMAERGYEWRENKWQKLSNQGEAA